MVVIRLARAGTKKKPFYHLSVMDKRSPRDGRFIERVGFYNPIARGKAELFRVDLERIDYWSSVGAQISPKVASIVKKARQLEETSESSEGQVASITPDENAAAPDIEASQTEIASDTVAESATDTVDESSDETIDEQGPSATSEDRKDDNAADENPDETEE